MSFKQGSLKLISTLIGGLLLSASAYSAEFVVKMNGQSPDFSSNVLELKSVSNLKILDSHQVGQIVKVNLSDKRSELQASLLELMSLDLVDYAVPNIQFHAISKPNDPRYSEQWSHQKTNSELAWDTSTGSKEIVVAVIDTGVDTNHEDLKSNIWVNQNEVAGNGIDDDNNGYVDDINGWDFKANDNDPMDETSDKNPGHGTHCSGIVGATGDNGIGIVGATQQVSIMAVRFLGADGSGDLYAAAKAIDYAINNGAHIISASWGAAVQASGAQPIIEAIGRSNDAGVIFIAAAANDGKNNDTREVYPANTDSPNMIAVAASQSDDTKPTWSNFGTAKVHVSAPGHQILSTLPGNKYGNLSGTSMATPFVSGLAALMLATSSETIDGPTMRAIMQSSGTKVAIETACECRVDSAEAISAVSGQTMVVVPNAATIAPTGTAQFSAWNGLAPFRYKSTNPEIASIDENGKLTAKAIGETTIVVTGSDDVSAQSLKVRIADKEEGGGEVCPLGDEAMCQMMCAIDPTLPWCKQ